MAYKILDIKTVVPYLFELQSIQDFFGDDASVIVKEIGDGNLNFVYLIQSQTDIDKALIVKQAVPYLRCVGESFPLGRQRMNFEIRALEAFYEKTPKFIPKIYHSDEAMSLVVMQYLGDCKILRQGMIEERLYPNLAEDISSYLAHNLFSSSSLYLNSTQKRALMDRFNTNTELCKLTEDFVFTFAFMDHETNDPTSKNNPLAKKLFEDMEFKKAVLGLKYKFMTQTDALLHGDLHTGSIMANQKHTYVIDPEFAFVGPFGFDIGAFVGNLVMSYNSHDNPSYRQWIKQTIRDTLALFESKFLHLWGKVESSALEYPDFIDDVHLNLFKKEFMRKIFQESVGFAGCKMTRRMFGIAGVADIRDIKDDFKRQKAIEKTLFIAKRFVKNHTFMEDIDDMMRVVEDADGL